MDACIFCKIIKGEIPSFKVEETTTHLAFLDINPNTKGVTLVIPKQHVESNLLTTDENIYLETLSFAKAVANKLAKKLNVDRVGLAIEGMGVNHLHIKLYPFHMGINPAVEAHESKDRVFNEIYPGYLTTQLGQQADFDELKKLSKELTL